MRNLSLLGKITIFKKLALSNIIHLALVTNVPEEFKMSSYGAKNKSKIEHDTLCNDYKNGGLKSADIFSKIVSVQCSWIRRLYDENFHHWKIIPLIIHPNLDLRNFSFKIFPKYYQEIVYR